MIEMKYAPITSKEMCSKTSPYHFLHGLMAMLCGGACGSLRFPKERIPDLSIFQKLQEELKSVVFEEEEDSWYVEFDNIQVSHKMEKEEQNIMYCLGYIMVCNVLGCRVANIRVFSFEKKVLEELGYVVEDDKIYW